MTRKWIAIGVIPQLTIWIAVTVILGTISGGIGLAVVRPRDLATLARV